MMSLLKSAKQKKRLTILVAFAAIYLIWGTTYLAIRIAVETIPPFLMAGVRFLSAGITLDAVLRIRGVARPDRKNWRSAAVVSFFLLVGGNGLVTWSEQKIPSGMAALLVATLPVWMTLLGWLLFGRRRPNGQTTAGIILGILGIALLVGPGQISAATALDLPSLIAICAAPVLWSFGSLYANRADLPQNIFMSTAIEMIAGGAYLLFAGLISGEPARLNMRLVTPESLFAVLYLTIFGSIVALTAYSWLLKTVDPAIVSTYTFVNPQIAIVLGWLVLNEPLTVQTLLAMGIILAAVLLINLGRREVHRPEPLLPAVITPEGEALAAGD